MHSGRANTCADPQFARLKLLSAVKTDLHLEIYRRLAEAGIVISFPQRDVHLDSDKPLRVSIEPESQPST